MTFTTTAPILATVSTTAITAITTTTATSGGNVTAEGFAAVTVKGVCWSTTANPTITDPKTTNGTGTGSFVSNLTTLLPGTLYHVRAYATNSVGTAYGNDVTFTTTAIVLPTLTSTAVTGVTLTTASSGGNITADGNGAISARGVCYATTPNPSLPIALQLTEPEQGPSQAVLPDYRQVHYTICVLMQPTVQVPLTETS